MLDGEMVHLFLHWLEALIMMNRLAEAIKNIGVLKSLVLVNVLPGRVVRQ